MTSVVAQEAVSVANQGDEPAYALFSGGKDSFATAKALEVQDRLLGCIALETGVSVPDWKPAVIEMCNKQNWPIKFFHTTDSYARVVRKYGFPGAGQHGMFMNYLKGRAIRVLKRALPGAVLASGVRADESARRALSTKPISLFEGVKVIAPLYNRTTEWVWDFVREAGYERPRAYSTLQISGDCCCGAFARCGEREAIRYWYPPLERQLKNIEDSMPEGHPHGKWGWDSARWDKAGKTPAKKGASKIICVECGEKQ